jgi:hypothetical protein
VRFFPKKNGQEYTEDKPPKRFWNASEPFFDLRLSHWIEVLLTVALIGVGVGQIMIYLHQAIIMDTQANIASRQLSLSESIERPWIKASIVKDGDLTYVSGVGVTFPFHFDLTNVGHLPAFNVQTLSLLYTPQKGEDVMAVWRKRCDDWKRQSDAITTAGTVLFPGQTSPSNETAIGSIPTIFYKDIDRVVQSGDSGGRIIIFIIGCVDYIIAGSRTHHQTGIFYKLGTQGPYGWSGTFDPHISTAQGVIIPVVGYLSTGMTY